MKKIHNKGNWKVEIERIFKGESLFPTTNRHSNNSAELWIKEIQPGLQIHKFLSRQNISSKIFSQVIAIQFGIEKCAKLMMDTKKLRNDWQNGITQAGNC